LNVPFFSAASLCSASCRTCLLSVDTILEPPLQTGGKPHQRCSGPTVRVGKGAARGKGRVVAIGGHRSSAGAEIVMGVRSVEGCRYDVVPDQVLRKLVFPLRSYHVRLVLGGTKNGIIGGHERGVVVLARVAGRAERMRPTEMQTIDGA